MADVKAPDRAWGVGRLGTTAAWVSAICCVPYLVLKAVWTLHVPLGITDRSVLDSGGWAAANAVMAVLQLTALLLVLALTQRWARRLPAGLVLFPVWVGTGMLFQVAVGAALIGFSHPEQTTTDSSGIAPWVFVMVYAAFAGQGAALAIAFVCHVRARWGALLRLRTGDVVATYRASRVQSGRAGHLATMAGFAAAMAATMAVAFSYWAAGGSFGLSDSQPHPPLGMQASRVIGAVVAVAGLLCLAGRWGSRRRFWIPAALVWVGSGALAAFDGFIIAFNQSFAIAGLTDSTAGWNLIDTALVVKVMIGVLAAAVGAAALAAAASLPQPGQNLPAGNPLAEQHQSSGRGDATATSRAVR